MPSISSPTPAAPLHWGTQALWEAVHPLLPGLSIEVVESLPSTNSELVDRLREAARSTEGRGGRAADQQPMLLVAIHQTQGRGRLGRPWQASAEASLTFSLALPLQRAEASGLSLVVGVALAEALDPTGTHLGLKWPNDLWRLGGADARKVGGILIETVTIGERRMAVIGIGLNILPQPGMDAALTASLSEFDPQVTAPQALACLLPPLAQALKLFENEGFAAFAGRFATRDVLRGRQITTSDAALQQAEALGVDDDGALRVLCPGTGPGNPEAERRIVSGEVSVRPVPLAPR